MFDFDTLRPHVLIEPEGLITRHKDLRRVAFTTAMGSLPRKPALMLAPETSVPAAAHQMAEANVSAALIVCSGSLLGLLTERDILASLCNPAGGELGRTSVWQAMTPEPPFCLDTDSVASAVRLMKTYSVRHLPVMRADGPPVGVLDSAAIIRWLSDQLTVLILD
ncbi:MAG TPA: CBS domain-containing protein [Polyangia bacterium]|jgi:CBS domain-containing protein